MLESAVELLVSEEDWLSILVAFKPLASVLGLSVAERELVPNAE